MTVRLVLFGSPSVEHNGESTALPRERRSQLLVYLALKRAWVSRTDLAALLWPDQPGKLAYTNLRKTLFRAQSLPWARGLEVQTQALRFLPATDVVEFDAALREDRVADALPLWRGELLAGFDDAGEAWTGWLQFERDRLRSAWRNAALNRLGKDIDAAEAVELSTRLLEADPFDEAALAVHMSWLARAGQNARARQTYRDFAERLSSELGLDPGAELKSLHESLGAMIAAPVPARAASSDDGFVGRSAEFKRIGELLGKSDCRLITIVGPGGVGKTRLALLALARHAPAFAGDAAFVSLEDLTSANALLGHVARELGIELSGRANPFEQVAENIGGRRMLLILDNCDDLADEASVVGRLLDACPALTIIATSRVRLSQPGEWLLALEGLPCPEIDDVDRIEAFDAARLFLRAAQRVEPALLPSVEAAAIVDICRQVDGLPLALELAAAWTRVLSCAAIAAELREGTELLRAVDPAQPSRHASFEVVFEQSWRMLTPIERDTLARLSAFRGGFAPEAARFVAGASFPVLGALADKSLLRKDAGRLTLHPLVHQLAGLRLEPAARTATAKAHALYFHRLLSESRRALESADRESLRRIETEFENCRVAWRWGIENAAPDLIGRSAPALLHFCDLRDRHGEGLALLREALAAEAVAADRNVEALLLAAAAHLEYRLDRYVEAETTATRAHAGARAGRNAATLALALQVLGSCSLRLGRHLDAREFFRQAHRQAVATNDLRKAGVMLHNEALVENALGETDEALRLYFQALDCFQQVGDVAGEALCFNNIGLVYMTRKEAASARAQFEAALALCDRQGLPATRGLILANLTELAMKSGDMVAATRHAAGAFEIAEATANRALAAWVQLQRARLALAADDSDGARRQLAEATKTALAIERAALQLDALGILAEILTAQGARDCAPAVLHFAAEHPSMSVPDRDDIRATIASWPESTLGATCPESLDLRGLAQRIVVETPVAYAPLIAALRGT